MQSQAATPDYFGRYQVVEELGSGAMGTVYLCVDALLARPVAVKVVRDSGKQSPAEREQYLARFRQEAEAAGRLSHPFIVQIYDIGPSYLVMEFLEGQPLSLLLARSGSLTVRQSCVVVAKVAEALDHAHRQGVVHRDVKPANIMVLEDGRVKVLDFGVARLSDSNLTVMGTVVGSLRYMPPEQMLGQKVDGKADLFSLAAVAYEMLTGCVPFPGETIPEVVSRVVQGRHVAPSECNPRLLQAIDAVFVRAFAVRPAERFATASEFAGELERAAAPILDLCVTYGAHEETEHTLSATADTMSLAIDEPAREDVPGRNGLLVVDSIPPGAHVLVDDRPLGTTPLDGVELPFGRHELRLQVEGREPVTVAVELHPQRPLRTLTVELAPLRSHGAHPRRFVEFGPGVTPPRRCRGDAPVYPEAARERGLEGSPVVEAWITEDGEVVDIAVVESAGSLLDTALLEAVAGWRFEPATRGGLPVAMRMTVQHAFRV